MEREERLRRRREQYRARRDRETAEERESRLEARRARERRRRAMMSTEQREILLQRRREARNRSEPTPESPTHSNEILSPNDPFVISKMSQFLIIWMD